ncbi:MAG: hypothetical protein IJ219_05065 [Bacteroidaceae bacterium]|nr:hypothetical protein [Bacteroidaceae bacterium]
MKKRLLMLFAMCLCLASSVLADEKYLVGDGTSIGWVTGDKRQLTKMTETSPGVFVWTGPLKHGNEGFKINSGENYVDPTYHPSSANFAMGDTGTDKYKTSGDDTKWNPTATEWTTYTITLDTNAGTLSWSKTDINPLTAEADGYIYISTAEELNKLALMCKCSVNRDQYKVKLTNDIDYTAYKDGSTACIGLLESNAFNGEFDGQNHTITIDMTTYSTRFGLFGTVNGTIHNLKVAGKITATTRNQIGGICGLLKGDGNKIYNCISAVEIVDSQNDDGTIGGIASVTYDASTIENCAFYGKINAPNRDGCGGIAGWCNAGASTTIKNCLIVADINWKTGTSRGNAEWGRNNPSVINCFNDASNEELANGQMTYKLNNKVSGGEDWFQTLDTDALPSPLSSSQKVYANGTFLCDGVTPKGGDVVLGNTNESVIDPHTFGEDGVCTVCKAAGEEATEVDGVFQLTKAGNLLWWAQYVNAGHPASNAVLTTDADLSAAKYTPAGTTENKYIGTFDGQGHDVTLNINNPTLNYQGLFGVATDGATIKNVTVKGSVKGNSYVAGILGGSNGYDDSKKLTLINCGNEAEITASEANGAGLIGVNMSGMAHFYMLNCYNAGNVTSGRESGAITGWSGGSKSTFTNVYNIGTITGGDADTFMRGGGTLVNTYNLTASDTKVTSGELCYLLNDGQSTIAWYQKLDEDAYPVLKAREEAIVYQNATYLCPNKYEGEVTYSNTESVIPEHSYENGICTVCGTAKADYLTPVDGVYEIDDLIKLNWFSHFVNDGNVTANAKLTADIAMESEIQNGYTPIGSTTYPYVGHFDGQGHSVTLCINNPGYEYQGLFGVITDGVMIEKVIVKGSVIGKNYVGGIAGGTNGGKSNEETKIFNCGNEADITANGKNGGGIIGVNMSSAAHIFIYNCYNRGSITSNAEGGAISGYSGGDGSHVFNCYNSGIVKNGGEVSKAFCRSTGTHFEDCFYTEGSGTDNSTEDKTYGQPSMVADAALASGELCYKLNNGLSTIAWYQKLGEGGDAYPDLFGTDRVYLTGHKHCDGTLYEDETGYSNTETVIEIDSHTYVDGICSYCGELDESYVTLTDDYYQISTEKQLVWFAKKVQNKATVNGKLTADIALSSAWTTSIGTQSAPYKGTFDGQNHKITGFNLTYDGGRQGLFGQVDGATVKNFSIAGTITANGNGGSSAGLGVIAWAESSTIQNVHSSLIVDATGTGLGSTHVGGVVGSLQKYNRVERCSFSGQMNGGSNKVDCFGCVVGYMTDGSVISNCANYGKLTYSCSEGNAGGILAYTWANQGGKIENCLNTGEIDYEHSTNGGAIVGWLRDYADRTSNNYILEGSASKPYGGQTDSNNTCTIVTAEQLASGEVCFGLGSVWYQTLGTDNYPTLDSSKPNVYQLAVGSAGYASFVPTVNVAALPEGVTAYAGQNKGTYLHLEPVTELPKDNAFIVKAEEGKYYYNDTDEAKTLSTSNDLKFFTEATASDGTQYCLANKAQGVGFYKVNAGTQIPAYKAYLQTTSGIKAFYGFDDDDATAIDEIVNGKSLNGKCYNLAGQRISKMQRGINIVDGKKILK